MQKNLQQKFISQVNYNECKFSKQNQHSLGRSDIKGLCNRLNLRYKKDVIEKLEKDIENWKIALKNLGKLLEKNGEKLSEGKEQLSKINK